jgi:Holliday junction resolvase RusA-like endonuclease
MFTSPRMRLAQNVVRGQAMRAGAKPIEGPVTLQCVFYLGDLRRVDLSNLIKLIEDALNKTAYRDDAQIVSHGQSRKVLSRHNPRTEVEVFSCAMEVEPEPERTKP